jgi:hypothetical protein
MLVSLKVIEAAGCRRRLANHESQRGRLSPTAPLAWWEHEFRLYELARRSPLNPVAAERAPRIRRPGIRVAIRTVVTIEPAEQAEKAFECEHTPLLQMPRRGNRETRREGTFEK